MPLKKSSSDAAFKANLKAELAAGRPKDQALAIAYRIQRDAKSKKMAGGGRVGYAPGGGIPFYLRDQARQTARPPGGVIGSAVPGRSDRIPMSPKGGSYVIPAFAVSSLGQGNTAAGAKALDRLFGTGVPRVKMPSVRMPRMPRAGFADGGEIASADNGVPIMASGGEYIVPPEQVAAVGGGDVDRGSNILDAFVEQIRKKTAKTLQTLPPPRKG